MEELVSITRSKRPVRDRVMSALRARWLGRDHPHSKLPSIDYLLLLDEMSDKIDGVMSLVLYTRLYGFSIYEHCLNYTTPPIVTTCPHFDIAIPTNLYPQEPEVYRYDRVVLFSPPCSMILTMENETRQVDSRHALIWNVGNDVYKIEGGERLITVHGELLAIIEPTNSYDETLPLGVVSRGGVLLREHDSIKCVGDGYVAWEPATMQVLRGAILTTVKWVKREETHIPSPLQLSPQSLYEKINYLLLEDLSNFIQFDLACFRVESILWEGRTMIERGYTRMTKDAEQIVRVAGEKVKSVSLPDLMSIPMISDAENDYRLWEEAKSLWNK